MYQGSAGSSDHCLTCGGAIFPPGVAVAYGGPICQCIVQPRYQRRASEQQQIFQGSQSMQMKIITSAEYDWLKNEVGRLSAELAAFKKESK